MNIKWNFLALIIFFYFVNFLDNRIFSSEPSIHFIKAENQVYISHGYFLNRNPSGNFVLRQNSDLTISEAYILESIRSRTWKPVQIKPLYKDLFKIDTGAESPQIYLSILYDAHLNAQNRYTLCQPVKRNQRMILMVSPESGELYVNDQKIEKFESSGKNLKFSFFYPTKDCNHFQFSSINNIQGNEMPAKENQTHLLQKTSLAPHKSIPLAILSVILLMVFYYLKLEWRK